MPEPIEDPTVILMITEKKYLVCIVLLLTVIKKLNVIQPNLTEPEFSSDAKLEK